ncbi:MAG: signal peptide peptidase SppA [Chitinispirillaceae bacterium]|nr:signal peptide peptidase SppA [Chitinispirillaceae bacterium]
MKNLQKIIIVIIICAPIIVGIIMLLLGRDASSGISRKGLGAISLKKLGLVKVEGPIYESESIVKQLRELREDKSIVGVLLRIDSPGGAVAPVQEIFREIMLYRKLKKPIVATLGNVAASGGYYVASAADKIFAEAGTLTGSIGVIMTVPLYKELSKKIGIEMRTFKAGEYKDITNPYRKMSDKEERMILKLLEDTHDQFIEDVAEGRNIKREELLKVADGRILTGRLALKEKLVDTLGNFESALSYLREITGVGKNAPLINKKETDDRVKEWFTREMLRLFPRLYQFSSPFGLLFMADL